MGAKSGTPKGDRLDVLATLMIGTRTCVAEILNRKRSLSIGMIRCLHDSLGISADVLIRPSQNDKAV